ncbi:MAG: ribonuclease HI [Gammaproteobacteria bacterium]|nr:ribonuclease HI [Gammaproteobacteria bacterium]
MTQLIKMYTDGACKGNPGPGGWGVILYYQHHEKTFLGAEMATTNNRMELTAAIKGLQSLTRSCQVELYTDSQYLRQGMTQWLSAWKKRGWKTSSNQAIKNLDLWQTLDELSKLHHIEWHWVKAHSGHPENERADQLANQAITELLTCQTQ